MWTCHEILIYLISIEAKEDLKKQSPRNIKNLGHQIWKLHKLELIQGRTRTALVSTIKIIQVSFHRGQFEVDFFFQIRFPSKC